MYIAQTAAKNGIWQRIRPLLPYILTAALFALGAYALYHLLKPVDLKQVIVDFHLEVSRFSE